MESDWKAGSPFKLLMEDGRIDSQGKVLESDPPRRLAVTWHVEWMEEFRHLPEAIVTFQIDLLGDVVRLTVSEFHPDGIDPKYLEGGRRGWPIILSGLKTLLETGSSVAEVRVGRDADGVIGYNFSKPLRVRQNISSVFVTSPFSFARLQTRLPLDIPTWNRTMLALGTFQPQGNG